MRKTRHPDERVKNDANSSIFMLNRSFYRKDIASFHSSSASTMLINRLKRKTKHHFSRLSFFISTMKHANRLLSFDKNLVIYARKVLFTKQDKNHLPYKLIFILKMDEAIIRLYQKTGRLIFSNFLFSI